MQVELSNSNRRVNIIWIFCCIGELEGIIATGSHWSSLYCCLFTICVAYMSKTIYKTTILSEEHPVEKSQRSRLILSAEKRRNSGWSKQHRTPRAPVFCWQKEKINVNSSSSWDVKGSVYSVSYQRSSSSLPSFSCVFHIPYCTFQLIHSHIYPYPIGQALFNCLPPGMCFSMYDEHCSY